MKRRLKKSIVNPVPAESVKTIRIKLSSETEAILGIETIQGTEIEIYHRNEIGTGTGIAMMKEEVDQGTVTIDVTDQLKGGVQSQGPDQGLDHTHEITDQEIVRRRQNGSLAPKSVPKIIKIEKDLPLPKLHPRNRNPNLLLERRDRNQETGIDNLQKIQRTRINRQHQVVDRPPQLWKNPRRSHHCLQRNLHMMRSDQDQKVMNQNLQHLVIHQLSEIRRGIATF